MADGPGADLPTSDEKTRPSGRFYSALYRALPLISLFIAGLSLAASISQSYNYRRNIESVQKNVLQAENLRSCKEIIEIFFTFRLKAEQANAAQLMEPAQREAAIRDMKSTVYRFGALGTFLANFSPEQARARYAALSWDLLSLAEQAPTMTAKDFDAAFVKIDARFSELNTDCARSAQLHD